MASIAAHSITLLNQHFLEAAPLYHNPPTDPRGIAYVTYENVCTPSKRKRGDTAEVVNEWWRHGTWQAKKAAKVLKLMRMNKEFVSYSS